MDIELVGSCLLVPDYRNEEILSEVVGTFGQFHYWNHEDDRLARSLVYASFPDNLLVPRDVVF